MTKGQMELINNLVEQHARAMVQLTYRRVGDKELAQDLVQETFLTACCKSEAVYEHDKPVAWLYNTLQKLTMREMNRSYHSSELPLPDEEPSGETAVDLPMQYYLPKELNGKERELILARLECGMSFGEIAEQKGISETACRQQYSRAMRKCRSLMEQKPEDYIKNF